MNRITSYIHRPGCASLCAGSPSPLLLELLAIYIDQGVHLSVRDPYRPFFFLPRPFFLPPPAPPAPPPAPPAPSLPPPLPLAVPAAASAAAAASFSAFAERTCGSVVLR